MIYGVVYLSLLREKIYFKVNLLNP